MKDGHYTQSDIVELNVYKEPKRAQVAIATLKSGTQIWSNGMDVHITENPGGSGKKQVYMNFTKDKVHPIYATVAEIVYKKAYGHGGYRPGAGRKKDENRIPKKTCSFRLTTDECEKVKRFIEDMRSKDGGAV